MKKSVLLILTVLVCSFVYAGDAEESLWSAAKSGDLAAIKKLVAEGVDVNAKTKYDATALAFACDKGHVDIVRYLLEQGVDVNTTDNFYNATPLVWAISVNVRVSASQFPSSTSPSSRVVPWMVGSMFLSAYSIASATTVSESTFNWVAPAKAAAEAVCWSWARTQ